jgi:ABC-2 type transport system permease protein
VKRYWVVAKHELITQLRRKTFLFFAFVFPLLMVGANLGIGYMAASEAEETGTLGIIGYVDQSGVLEPALEKPEEFRPYADEAAAKAALAAEAIGAYFSLPADYYSTGMVSAYTLESIPGGIEGQLRGFIRANLLAGRDALEAERLRNPAEVTMTTLDGKREVDQDTALALILTPIVFAMIFGMSITMTSSFLMQNVAEEKETGMVELMMTSITPLEMLWGKILGLGSLGLLQMAIWAVTGGMVFIANQGAGEMLASIGLPAWLPGVALLYLLLGYLLYGSLLAGVGASSGSAQEAQSISAVFALLALSPMIAFVSLLKDPNGPVPLAMSLFPFTSPTAMIMRISLGQVPPWQILLSLVLLAAGAALVVWLAAWVFRVGLLMVGKRLKLGALIEVIRQGADQAALPLEDSTAVQGS